MSRKKKKRSIKYKDIDLNIMPFIDVFSLLNVFLLMSAVFLSVGVLEVQIPFLTSAPPQKDVDRTLDIKVDLAKDKIEVTTEWSKPPIDKQVKDYNVTAGDIQAMHKFLIEVRRSSPDTDKVQLFTDDDVLWKDISHVLDEIKVREPGDPVFPTKTDNPIEKAVAAESLFPKVVMASVML